MPTADSGESLRAEILQAGLASSLIGHKIVVLEETTSTNDTILQMAGENPGEGLVVFAEHQTAGRGQRGNKWVSAPRRGLWFSILLRPRIDLSASARLTAWAARTVANTINGEFALAATVKSPNDVLVDQKKVAGVLVEMRAQKAAPHLAVAGIGMNVNQSANDFPEDLRPRAISLAMALGRTLDRQKLALALLKNLDRAYGELLPR